MFMPKRYEIVHKEEGLVKSFRNEKGVEKYLRDSLQELYNLEIYSWINQNVVRWKTRADNYMKTYYPPREIGPKDN